jgi:hypothetical protein
MNEFEKGLFSGTPDIDDKLREEARQSAEARQQRIDLIEQQQPTEQKPQAPTPQATAPAAEEPAPQPEPQPDPKEQEDNNFYGLTPSFQQDDIDPSAAQVAAEAVLAPFTGPVDAVVDLFNLVPGVDLPKIPEFENEVTQTVRELSSIVLPTIGLTATGVGALGAAAKASKAKFLLDPMVARMGNIAFSAGTGAFVDYTVEINQEDDNLSGVLKKNWPSWYGWIPEDLATLDSDSPDIKRAKNVTEGVYLGVGTDVLVGTVKLLSKVRGLRSQYIPQSEKAKKVTDTLNLDVDPDEAVNLSAGARSDAMDELGKYNFDRSVELKGSAEEALKEPIYGVHDLFDPTEMGIRSVDLGGINMAAIDSYRINNNVGSINGRVGSIGTDPYVKYGLDLSKDHNIIFKGLAEQLKDVEIDVKLPDGTYITAKQIAENGEEMAAKYYMLPVDVMKQMFVKDIKESGLVFKEAGVETLSSEGMEAARLLTKKYLNDMLSMDQAKAEAYLATSVAGQISDTAQGMRLVEGTAGIERAQEQIIDRLEFLMAMRGRAAYVRGRALNLTNMWNRLTMTGSEANKAAYAKRIKRILAEESNETLRAIEAIRLDAALTARTLREVHKEKPEMLAPLLMAYEFTDGNVDTMAKLNRFLQNSTGTITKAFFDRSPEIPSVVVQGFFSNVYNATLSAFATPIKAGLSNAAGLIEKPIGAFIGGIRYGEGQMLRRGWYQYSLNLEVLQDSFDYMKQVFKRSATEADVAGLQRENYFVKNQKQIEILQAVADAKAAEGDFGPQVAMQQIQAMNDLSEHPWLRFGNRAMQALDGFTQTMVAHADARGRAFDKVTNNGKLEFTAAKADTAYKQIYKEMFDESGLITDSAVKHTAGEISLSLDSGFNDAFSALIRRAPILKPFLLFTKTPINDIKMMASYSPHHMFFRDINDFRLRPENMADNDIADVLLKRKIDAKDMSSETMYQKYNEIRADLFGRSALGTLMVSAAVGLFLTDRLTGNGLYDKQKQALRRETDWKPRSIRLPGGEWVSYDNLGPITNWLALIADISDNMDVLSPNDIGEQLRKMGFVLAASFTDKSFLSGLEPFIDVIRGDVGAINRWSGSFINAAIIPGSSQMAEIGRLMDPGLKEVEMTILDVARNRLPVLKTQIPPKYDWIDGDLVGVPDNFMARVWNNYMPWKVNGRISEEKRFLQMIEYDARPSLRTNGRGIEYTPTERSEITRIMGRDKLFLEGIRRVMNSTEGREFRKRYMENVRDGLDPDLSTFELLHKTLDRELRYAMDMAAAMLPNNDAMTNKMIYNDTIQMYQQSGEHEAARRFQQKMREQHSF